jgi:hypothetical protein
MQPVYVVYQESGVRREECGDLVLIDRIGQNPQGLIGYLRESCFAQHRSEMLPGILPRDHQLSQSFSPPGGDCGPGEN